MGFFETLGRVAAAVATGGLSEVGLAAYDVLTDEEGEASTIYNVATGGAVGGAPCGGTGGSGNVNINACCNYKLHGNFLLDTRTGKVWIYNKNKNVFVRINKENTRIETTLLVSYLEKVKMKFEKDFKALGGAEQKKVKEVFAMNNTVLAQRIVELKKIVLPTPTPRPRAPP